MVNDTTKNEAANKTANGENGETAEPSHFIRDIIREDMKTGKWAGRVHTRFPPEPNGYLHIGHAKSICLNFGLAIEFNGKCNLRYDDTNPLKEDIEYVNAIRDDVHWLGFDWEDREFFASDYFDWMYECAVNLIKKGKAYVDHSTEEEIRDMRGTVTQPGVNSRYRDRSVDENLDLFERMKKGEFKDGECVLRARIDMAAPNMKMRDPIIYRIRHASHHRTGDKWCIYPMYDFAHCLEDSIEKITHSICTLEFEINRALYDWYLDKLEVYHPQQIEFARLNLSHTVMSKRKLLELVNSGVVWGWDDPRMPTLSGLRRRGYTPESIRDFCERIGVGKADNMVDIAQLEYSIREDLNRKANRVMAVLRPLKVVILNYPEKKVEMLEAVNNPEDPESGSRMIPFSREIYIEQDDFMENPPKKYFRLYLGNEVRLKHAYFIKCIDVIKDEKGEITEVHCTYDPASKSGEAGDGRKVKGTLHWVSAEDAVDAEARLFEHLFTKENPDEDEDFKVNLNQASVEILRNCKVEPSLKNAQPGTKFQFLRQGYFCVDEKDSKPGSPVFNRTVSLKDTWAKIVKRM
jgi:glutaminyl-tRNA synthetase